MRLLTAKIHSIIREIFTDENFPVPQGFSDQDINFKLIMFLVAASVTAGIYLCAYAMSLSSRKDLALHYAALMVEIARYGEEGNIPSSKFKDCFTVEAKLG
ncbi:MAG: DUF3231 family protein [Desulfitobacterium hafniense]|nr:DUF3231 family protein [Desulfitobacterium hafniense]